MSSAPVEISADAYETAAYLRVASVGIAGYDFLGELPTIWRFYRDHARSGRLSAAPVLLFLIQLTSICALIVSNTGFFYGKFTDETCRQYYLLPPIFKVLQAMASQIILATRVFNLSQRRRRTAIFLVGLFCAASAMEWVTTLLTRTPSYDTAYKVCQAVFQLNHLGAWVYYAVAIGYDLAMTVLMIMFIRKFNASYTSSIMSDLVKMVLVDGLGYFVVLTAVNCANLVMYRTSDEASIRTAASSLAYTMTWIMSQKLLLNLHRVSMDKRNESISAAVTLTRAMQSPRQIADAARSQFERKNDFGRLDLTVPDFDMDFEAMRSSTSSSADSYQVEVRVERTVQHHDATSEMEHYTLEDYSRNYGHRRISR